MNGLVLAFTIVQLLAGVFLIVVVLLQSGKSSGLSGAVAGGAETFFSKGKATPFAGMNLRGRVKATLAGGKIVYLEK